MRSLFGLNFAISWISILQCIYSFNLYDKDSVVCVKDLEDICGLNTFPDSIQSLYDSQKCLRENQDIVTMDCKNYLKIAKPSVIESCLDEIKKTCLHVTPDEFRIHFCLSEILQEELSMPCRDALGYDLKVIDKKAEVANVKHYLENVWIDWSDYIGDITITVGNKIWSLLKFVSPSSNQIVSNSLVESVIEASPSNSEEDYDYDDSYPTFTLDDYLYRA